MSSVRERAKRLNQGVFISGKSGSGKSRMTQRLAAKWERVIYIDPMHSFDAEHRATSLRDAFAYLAPRWNEHAFSLAVQFDNDDDYTRMFSALYTLMRKTKGAVPNFLLVIDECDMWSSPYDIDRSIARIMRFGRHYGCSWIANCRADVHTNRDIRMNAQITIVFRQGMLSSELRREIQSAEADREVTFPRVSKLIQHGPGEPEEAIEGRHFIAIPDSFAEWLPTWEALAADAAPTAE